MKVQAFIGFIIACASSFILFQSGNGSWLSEARDVPSTTNRTQEIIWHGSVNSTSIAWDSDNLRIVRSNGQTTSFKVLAQYEFHRLREEQGIKGCAFDYQVRIKSLVGQFMTVEIQKTFRYDFLAGDQKINGPFSDYHEIKTLDVSKAAIGSGGLRELMLTDLFDEADVENALFSERSFQQACQSGGIDCRKGGLKDLLTHLAENGPMGLESDRYEIRPDFLSRFYFEDMQGSRVILRLQFPAAHRTDNSTTELELELPVSQQLLLALDDAKSGRQGFLGSQTSALFGDCSSRIAFVCSESD